MYLWNFQGNVYLSWASEPLRSPISGKSVSWCCIWCINCMTPKNVMSIMGKKDNHVIARLYCALFLCPFWCNDINVLCGICDQNVDAKRMQHIGNTWHGLRYMGHIYMYMESHHHIVFYIVCFTYWCLLVWSSCKELGPVLLKRQFSLFRLFVKFLANLNVPL